MDDECYGPGIEAAEVVLPCADLEPTLAFFTGRLGFRIASIFPAEAPRVAVVSGHGLRLRLDPRATGEPGSLRLLCRDPSRSARLHCAGANAERATPGDAFVIPPGREYALHDCSGDLELLQVAIGRLRP